MSAGPSVLLFQLGPRLYAARAEAVARIEPAAPGEVAESPLGAPFAAARRLLVADGRGGLTPFPVDAVVGMGPVAAEDLQPLPALARGLVAPGVTGLVLWRGAPTPLVDLPTLLQRGAEPPAAERSRDG